MAQVDLKAFTAELANELGATVDDSAALVRPQVEPIDKDARRYACAGYGFQRGQRYG